VTVALSTGPTTTTNSSGNYSFSNLPTGTYTVTPSLGGYTFTPSSQTFTNITSNQTANFTAALATRAVSIKFVGTGTSMGASESAGVVAKTNWNNATGNTSSSALNLVDETGVANGASVTWDSDVSWNLPITDSPGNFRMIRGYIDSLNASDSSTVAVTGLPASPNGYDIYVYSDGDNQTGTETGTFRLSGAGITTTNFTATDLPNTNFSGTFIQAINSAGNYVKFTAVHATAFTITATPAISSDGVFRAPINGIQIIPSAAPGTARTVGIKLVGTGTAMGATESAGVIAKANWNNATGNNSSSPLNLVDETGAANGAIATWASDVSWNLPVTDSAGNVRMMRGYIDSLSASDSSTVNVTGLPPSSTGYDIYVYTDGDNQTGTEKGNYQLTGPGITTVNFTATDLPNTNFSGTFTRAINSAGNYVKFTAVQATTFTITATPAASSDGVFRAPINSIQIVPSAAPGVARAVGIKLVGAGTAMGASESAGVVAKTNWNNATGTTSGSPLSLVDETGAANGASATWASDVSWNLPIADSAGNVRMMRGYIDSLNGSDSNTVTVADLPPSPTGYDIYVYTDGDNATAAKTATYQLSGAGIITASNTATDSANTNFSGTFTQANNSAGNYVKFTAIQATSFTITATPKTAANGVLRAPVNGIQVVPH
jgi:phosphopentomutase